MTPQEKMAAYIARRQAVIEQLEQQLDKVPPAQRPVQQTVLRLLKKQVEILSQK
ncbi:hypothetical protein EV586_10221 [Tumebacillus sp. BK434]|uniref:hypothetical protein n=1 Tax=Tumebacillus sp. BK434 TaxID=2512169 RepID=UPI0010DFC3C3|nr:hypothetical protein [Tumebacillus sp. BK434]TCP57579.1 hypothetical protein EV586_10221 [Tumebacillus sp. BK434]